MDQKRFSIKDWQRKTFTFVELCDRYGISRKTGYKGSRASNQTACKAWRSARDAR